MMKQFDLQHSHRRLVIGQTGPTRNFGAWSCELPVSEFLRAAYSRRSPRSYLLALAEEEDKKMPR